MSKVQKITNLQIPPPHETDLRFSLVLGRWTFFTPPQICAQTRSKAGLWSFASSVAPPSGRNLNTPIKPCRLSDGGIIRIKLRAVRERYCGQSGPRSIRRPKLIDVLKIMFEHIESK